MYNNLSNILYYKNNNAKSKKKNQDLTNKKRQLSFSKVKALLLRSALQHTTSRELDDRHTAPSH